MIEFSRSLDTGRKLIVEYWADGPSSELPPGHWGIFAQFVSQRDNHTIDQDAKMFFAMHNASFDAGIVAWHIKRKYNGVRPITAVRFEKQGQTITAWGGPGRPIEGIPGEKWSPYNPGTNLSPSFPAYFSGHSVFSRSSATVLALFTGDNISASRRSCPRISVGWNPDSHRADHVLLRDVRRRGAGGGTSRLYGGIHFPDDNTTAQRVGFPSACGRGSRR